MKRGLLPLKNIRLAMSLAARNTRWRKFHRMVCLGVLGWTMACISYSKTHSHLGPIQTWVLHRETEHRERDPGTGVIVGAETEDFDPSPAEGFGNGSSYSGGAVLLLHGVNGTPRDFGALGPALAARGLHVRALRLPGHGTTPDDFAAQTTATLMNGVCAAFDDLQADYGHVDVVGFSMGGTLATLLAAERPVRRLVLTAPYFRVTYNKRFILPAETWNTLAGYVMTYAPKMGTFEMLNRRDDQDKIISYRAIPQHGINTLFELGDAARSKATTSRVTCPVRLAIADGDEAASPDAARDEMKRFASADREEWKILPRSNHLVFWDYDREVLIARIADYLGE